MKLLFDENISFKVATTLAGVFPGSAHVRETGLESSGDEVIWSYARKNGFAIVSKDSDFRQRSFLFDTPPKIIWIKRGNCSTKDIEGLLRQTEEVIKEFLADNEATFLELE